MWLNGFAAVVRLVIVVYASAVCVCLFVLFETSTTQIAHAPTTIVYEKRARKSVVVPCTKGIHSSISKLETHITIFLFLSHSHLTFSQRKQFDLIVLSLSFRFNWGKYCEADTFYYAVSLLNLFLFILWTTTEDDDDNGGNRHHSRATDEILKIEINASKAWHTHLLCHTGKMCNLSAARWFVSLHFSPHSPVPFV